MRAVQTFDAIVIGAGVMGCSASYALAKAGCRTLLLERGVVGHRESSSHGRSRIIRLAYSDPHYIDLSRLSYSAWAEIEDEVGECLVEVTGGLDIALEPTDSLQATAAAMSARGVAFDELTPQDVRRRFPQFNVPEGASALYQKDTSALHADRCVRALADLALAEGTLIYEGEEVRSVQIDGRGVEVTTSRETYAAGKLVICAGAHIGNLLAPLGIKLPLVISKEQVAFFKTRDDPAFATGRIPIFVLHLGDGRLGSGFPLLRDPGVKVMIERRARSLLDDDAIDASNVGNVEQYMRGLLPDLTELLHVETCWYTITPDNDFILDQHPEYPHLVIASPCSGHGFKFAPVLGAAIADLALGRASEFDPTPFRLDRPSLQARAARALPDISP